MEVGVKESFKKKLVRSSLKWAGCMERIGDEKRADAQKVEGKMKRGRSIMRWEDCVKRSGKSGRRMENNNKR